jgi:hypothetical protein
MNKNIMGGGAILVAILMALTTWRVWPDYLDYIWAALVAIWGILAFMGD